MLTSTDCTNLKGDSAIRNLYLRRRNRTVPSSTTLDPSAESLAVRVGAWQQFSLNIGAILRLGYMAHVVTSGICRYIRAVTRFCPLRADGSALLVPRRFAYAFCHKPLHQHFERCHSAQVWLLPCRPMVWRIHGQAKLRRSYGGPRQDQGLQSDVVSRARAEWPLPLQLRHHRTPKRVAPTCGTRPYK